MAVGCYSRLLQLRKHPPIECPRCDLDDALVVVAQLGMHQHLWVVGGEDIHEKWTQHDMGGHGGHSLKRGELRAEACSLTWAAGSSGSGMAFTRTDV